VSPIVVVAASGFIALILIIPLLVYIICIRRRHSRLKSHVQGIADNMTISVGFDSPMSRLMSFFRRYQNSTFFTRPSVQEAAEMQALLVKYSGQLATPHLDESADLNQGIRSFLMHSVGANRSRSFDGGLDFVGRASTNNLKSRSGPRRNMSRGTFALDSIGSETTTVIRREDSQDSRGSFDTQRDSALISELLAEINVPAAVKSAIGNGFFLDFISPSSPVSSCSHPVTLVVSQCLQSSKIFSIFTSRPKAYHKLLNFTTEVEMGYSDTMYHCKKHAADVTNRLMAIMTHSELADLPCPRNHIPVSFVALIAAAVHDYGHPQLNNAFLVATGHPMATRFNDQAVAENHALHEVLWLLEDPSCDFISNMAGDSDAPKRRRWFRSMLIQMVLATDMSRHFELLSQFNTKVASSLDLAGLKTSEKWKLMTDEQRFLTLQISMKVADLGHCALPLELHKAWTEALEEEFFRQGDMERELGMPISPLMDRFKPGATAPSNQIGFFKVVVMPLYTSLVKVFPQCQPLLDQAHANLTHWTALARQEQITEADREPVLRPMASAICSNRFGGRAA